MNPSPMHAWDCVCGTRNAPQFQQCRSCGRPAGAGRLVTPQQAAPPTPSGMTNTRPSVASIPPRAPAPAPIVQPAAPTPLSHPTASAGASVSIGWKVPALGIGTLLVIVVGILAWIYFSTPSWRRPGWDRRARLRVNERNPDATLRETGAALPQASGVEASVLHHGRAQAFYFKGQYEDGLREMDLAIQSDPQNVRLYSDRATMKLRLGRADEAVEDFTRTINGDPQAVAARAGRGEAYITQHRLPEALRDFDEAIRQAPDQPDAHAGRATAVALQGKWDEAIKELNTVLRLKPGDGFSLIQRGTVHGHQGLHQEAIKDLREGLRAKPNDPQGLYGLASELDMVGNRTEAISYYRQFLAHPAGDLADRRTEVEERLKTYGVRL